MTLVSFTGGSRNVIMRGMQLVGSCSLCYLGNETGGSPFPILPMAEYAFSEICLRFNLRMYCDMKLCSHKTCYFASEEVIVGQSAT